MNKKLPWIKKSFFLIISLVMLWTIKVEATRNSGIKGVILFTYDDSIKGSSIVTMQVDQETFMNVIKDSQTNVKHAKPMKFAQDNGFLDFFEGNSTVFSFETMRGEADCNFKCSQTIVTSTTADPCGGRGKLPFCCENGANNKDCCLNGGKGKYCCKNEANNPSCTIPTTPSTRRTSTPAPTYLPPTTLPPIRADSCPQGGSGKYCCKNGANNSDCCKIGRGPYCCENGANNIDCCLNNGKGKYCCTNGFDNPTCLPLATTSIPLTTTTRPQRPPIFISKKPVFQGPSYLPVARITTERPSTTSQTYTYGTRPSYRHSFGFTNAYWSHVPYSTRNLTTRATTTTAKYEYKAPINGIHYNGADDDNSL